MTEVQTSRARWRSPATTPASGGGGLLLIMGFIGALVYFWTRADTGGERLLAVLKALVWPAYLVYGALRAVLG